MATELVTIPVDPEKITAARALVGAESVATLVDIALDELVRSRRVQREIEAYERTPQTPEERAVARFASKQPLDDTDWEALYAVDAE